MTRVPFVAMRRAAVLAVVVLVLAACGGDDDEPEAASSTTEAAELDPIIDLTHYFVPGDGSGILRDTDDEGTNCGVSGLTRSTDDLAFMEPGAEVLLRDDAGKIVAETTLSVGSASGIDAEARTFTCAWRVKFNDVARVDFYQVEVSGETVGTLQLEEVADTSVSTPAELPINV